MPINKIDINEFVQAKGLILDVRSPSEYQHAHIPGALSLPLFTDEERKVIGTSYKQDSREKAIKIGLESFGKNMVGIVEQVEKILSEKKITTRSLYIHCWRGGMRSAAVAWLLDLYGFKVYLLNGGYKTYRNLVVKSFERQYHFKLIGGYTGSDKTGLLKALAEKNINIIDLEGLALHKGSVFGNLEKHTQPTQEMFENLLAEQLMKFSDTDLFWVEDESQRLGDVNIPIPFYKNMRSKQMLFLEVPFEQRLQHLLNTYGTFEKEMFINGILRIKKKLGGLETKTAVNCILEDDLKGCFSILLKYYDKFYLKSSFNRENADQLIQKIESDTTHPEKNVEKINKHV